MHNYIVTRFSVHNPNNISFNRPYPPEVLFNKERLDFKFKVFDMMTYPSIKNQTSQNYTWWIFTSQDLPEEYSKKLDSYADSNIQIIRVNSDSKIGQYIGNKLKDEKNYCTIRIDDDDGLSPDFLMNLQKYENETGKIVSFPYGRYFRLTDEIEYGNIQYFPKQSAGLCGIGLNIFSAGNHRKVNEKFEVIYDNTPESYYVCCSNFCVTKRKFR